MAIQLERRIPQGVEKLSTLAGHKDEISGLVWSPHERALASQSRDNHVIIWKDASSNDTATEDYYQATLPVWSRREYGLLVHDSKEKRLYRVHPFASTRVTLLSNRDLYSEKIWCGIKHIAVELAETKISLIDIEKKTIDDVRHSFSNIHQCEFSPDSSTMLVSSYEGEFELYYTSSRSKIRTRRSRLQQGLKGTWRPDGEQIATDWDEGSIQIWDSELKNEVVNLLQTGSPKKSFSFSPDGRLFLIHSNDKKIHFLESSSWREKALMDISSAGNAVIPVAWHPTESLFASISEDNSEIDIWEYDAETILKSAPQREDAEIDSTQKIAKKSRKLTTKKKAMKKTAKRKKATKKTTKRKTKKKVSAPTAGSISFRVKPAAVQLAIKAISDKPIDDQAKDLLNYNVYAKALADFIMLRKTNTPLTLAIDAPWGKGKSSIMKLMKNEVKEYGLIPIWFNAWRYEKAENLWAALAQKLLNTVQEKWRWRRRIFFGLALYWRRFKEEHTDLGISMKILKGLFFLVKSIIKGPISTIKLSNLRLREFLFDPNYKERAGFIDIFHNDFERIVNLIRDLEAKRKRSKAELPEGFKKADQGRLVIFIDDLDRCPPPKPVEIIEAINVILNFEHCVFVLGMDLDMICASIETKYDSLLEYLRDKSEGCDPRLGQRFMEKIVEVNFRIPEIAEGDLKNLYSSFFVQGKKSEIDRDEPAESAPREQTIEERHIPRPDFHRQVKQIYADSKDEIEDPGRISEWADKYRKINPDVDPTIVSEVKRHMVGHSFNIDSPEVQEAVELVAGQMDPNPRKIKRFINIFRLRTTVAVMMGRLDETITLNHLAQWTFLYMDWPELAKTALDSPLVLMNLIDKSKKVSRNKTRKANIHSDDDLLKKIEKWRKDSDLMKFLKSLEGFSEEIIEKLKSL